MRRLRIGERRDERGAVTVEFALALPLIAVLLFGVLDYGFLWRQSNLVEQAAQQAARTASGSGNWRFADFEALRAVDSTMSGTGRMEIDRVIIWRTDDPDGAVPCLGITVNDGDVSPKGSTGDRCNVYSGAQVATTNPAVGFSADPNATSCDSGTSWDYHWCPTDRTAFIAGGAAPDYIGVYVEVTYRPLTGIITTSEYTVERDAVYRIEPCVSGISRGDCT